MIDLANCHWLLETHILNFSNQIEILKTISFLNKYQWFIIYGKKDEASIKRAQ